MDGEQDEYHCIIDGCKRRVTAECLNSMCFICCCEKGSECVYHLSKKLRKQETERYIDEGLGATTKKKHRRFIHVEDKFDDYNQTVLVWCFYDFMGNKKWNQDTFQYLERIQDRQQRAHGKRMPSDIESTDGKHQASSKKSKKNLESIRAENFSVIPEWLKEFTEGKQ